MSPSSLSLSLLLIVVATAPAEAVKVILEKEVALDEDGQPEGFSDFSSRTLEALHFDTIAEYGYFLAGEVAEGDLVSFQRRAQERKLLYEIRRDFDLIQVNGYVFSSFGQPTGLPEGLVLTEYEGDVGLYLVQFKAPITTTWWRGLQTMGAVVAYYPENTFLIRAARGDMPVLRRVDGVQHVSLFQPAYKIRRSLLSRSGLVEVDLEFDGDQDLNTAAAAWRGILDEDVAVERIGRFAYSRLTAARNSREALLRRPEVLWVEPALGFELSGEMAATVAAGKHDGLRPQRFPGLKGHQAWLLDKGFCIPTDVPESGGVDCMPYWSKVGVIDTGLDRHCCDEASYNTTTRECSQWDSSSQLHPDLNHVSNVFENCDTGGDSLDPLEDCTAHIIRATFFCSRQSVANHCLTTGSNPQYVFSDSQLHGTAVASIIAGDPWSLVEDVGQSYYEQYNSQRPGTEGFYRGVGIAPSAQVIVAKYLDLAEEEDEDLKMTPQDFRELVKDIANQGARFVNNSWNLKRGYVEDPQTDEDQYYYTLFSKFADFLVRDGRGLWRSDGTNREMTIVFSAGNWDTAPAPQAAPDPFSFVTSPANAKNVISVGATRGWALQANAGDPLNVCASEDAEDYVIRDIPGFSFGGTNENFHSRRGYIYELGSGSAQPRYKPDLIAMGTHLAAARSRNLHPDNYYQCFGGTSAAAPAVTASAVLAEAWYWYKLNSDPMDRKKPSPAMIRAMLVARADSLKDPETGVAGTDLLDGSPLGYSPSLPQGFGRVNLDKLFQEEVPVLAFDQDTFLFTGPGQYWQEQIEVADPSKDLIVVMVYTDRFSAPGAALTSLTVNDLDLKVGKFEFTDFHSFYGNHFENDSWYSEDYRPLTQYDLRDSHNTVEVVRVKGEVLDGPFAVQVRARSVNGTAVPEPGNDDPTQDFALFIYNAVMH